MTKYLLSCLISVFVTPAFAVYLEDLLACSVVQSQNRFVSVGAATSTPFPLSSLNRASSVISLTNPDGGPTRIFIYEEMKALGAQGANTVVFATDGVSAEFSEMVWVSKIGPKKISLKIFSGRNRSVIGDDGVRTRDFVPTFDYGLQCDVQ